ncbi:MAG: DUF4149 domain-containing protein [Blastocatellia bacterium]|nr:DUF4149 domain-containing protein [Blastocatellia bacterium]
MKFLSDIRLLILAIWLGAACFFIVVAQSAFAVLPERELAGAMVNRTLAILNYSGLLIGLILLASSWIGSTAANKFLVWLERLLFLLIAAACAVGQFVIAWWLLLVRREMGRPIDQVPLEDPLRIQFNNLHEYSVWVLLTAMIAALIAFFVIANKRLNPPPAKDPLGDFKFDSDFKI